MAEVQQTLLLNSLRDRVTLEVDGKLLTGRDVAIAALFGAERFGFGTAPLLAIGCHMLRVCHLNTCPYGVCTQDEKLRKRFKGKPEYIINFMHFVAEDLREIMARLGFHTVEEMIGRYDCLKQRDHISHWKARTVNLKNLLYRPYTDAPWAITSRRLKTIKSIRPSICPNWSACADRPWNSRNISGPACV